MRYFETAAALSLGIFMLSAAAGDAAALVSGGAAGVPSAASASAAPTVPAIAGGAVSAPPAATGPQLALTEQDRLGIGHLPQPTTRKPPKATHGILPMTSVKPALGNSFRRSKPAETHGIIRQSRAAPALQIDPAFLPTTVSYETSQPPGTIVIDTEEKYLYFIEPGGVAKRYGVGVGRPGFQWAGTHRVSMKREWPGWTPPAQMRKRQPELPAFMPGGPENPLGARAMYLGNTLYRIHGSNAPWTIGHEVSSGCIRMRNEDVMELYERVNVGTKVVVVR